MYENVDYCPSLSVTYKMTKDGDFYPASYKCEAISDIEGVLNFISLKELIAMGGMDR